MVKKWGKKVKTRKKRKRKRREKKRLRLKEEKESSEEVGGKIDLEGEEDYLSKGINLYAIGSEGIALYVLGEYDEAFYLFDKAIKLNPNDYYFYYWRGRIYFEKRLYDQAIQDFDKAIRLKSNVHSYYWRGRAYFEKCLYDKAIEDFTKCIKLHPKNGEFYYMRGQAYFKRKLYREAVRDFNKAIKLNPNYDEALKAKKEVEKLLKSEEGSRTKEEKKEIKKLEERVSAESNPNNADFYYHRGRAYFEKGLYNEAIECFTKAIELKPDEAYFYGWRGIAYYEKVDYGKAIEDFTEAIELEPDEADFYYWRGKAYYEKVDYGKAIEDFTKAIKLKPDEAGFYYLRGNAYYWKEEYEKAIKDFNKVLELNPSYKEAREAKKEVENLIEYKKKSLVKSGNGSSYEEARKAKKEVESLIESKKKSLIKSEDGRKAFKVSFLLMLFLTSVPMLVILGTKDDWQQRFIETIKENQEKIRISQLPDNLSSLDEVIDYVIYQLPDHKIKGAALPRDTNAHFIIALVSWWCWMVFFSIFLSSSSNEENWAILSSLFTAISGILILLVIQLLVLEIYKSGIWKTLKIFRGRYSIFGLILYFIGFSYYGALDPESGFIKSFIGFTFGVGLCEELVKLIPVVWLMKKAFKREEISHLPGILLVGLASGVGFGVAEGIMYSAQFYNGIHGWDVYWVRFVTCVALHSTWTGIAVLSFFLFLFREEETTKNEKAKDEKNKEDEKKEKSHISIEEQSDMGFKEIMFMLAIFSVVAIILHGLYDTLLKKGEDFLAFVVAITTFVVFYYLLSKMYEKENQI